MMTIREISELSGMSVRALRYYDEIGLLKPTELTEAGYRLYDDTALQRLHTILLFREMEFPLGEIARLLDASDAERNEALDNQVGVLERKKAHITNLITLARGLRVLGVKNLDFTDFDVKKIDEYERQAEAAWGQTEAFREYREKSAGRTAEDNRRLAADMMEIFAAFGRCRKLSPADPQAQELVLRLRDFISAHYYSCSDDILLSLSTGYGGGGSMNDNIDRVGGEGTGAFARRAVEYFVAKRRT